MKPYELINRWMQGVNEADVELLSSLYDANALLIPTFSNHMLKTPEQIRGYFERLASREGLSISLHEKLFTVQPINGSFYTMSGLYNWQFIVDDELLNFEARFSYFIDAVNPRPILHHHSSQIPRMI